MNQRIIKSIERFSEGMKLEIKSSNYFDDNQINGIVSAIEHRANYRLINYKMVRTIKVYRVTVSCMDGKELIITPRNFYNFQIRQISKDN